MLTGVGDQPPGRVVQVEQHVDGDLAEDQRILLVARCLSAVVRQQACLDVAPHVSRTEQCLPQAEQRDRTGDVELHAERRRREDHPADGRREIMDPGSGDDRSHAVGDDHHVLRTDAVVVRDMRNERVGILDKVRDALGRSTTSVRAPVAARIPGEHGHVSEVQRIDDVLPSAAMFVSAMEEHDRSGRTRPAPVFRPGGHWQPHAIGEPGSVPRGQRPLDAGS